MIDGRCGGAGRQQEGRVWADVVGVEFQDLGVRLRRARKVKKLRLKDEAISVGCSESLLSKIERDKTTPSLRTLHRIVSVLDTSIASLFADPGVADFVLHPDGERPVIVIEEPERSSAIRLERLTPNADDQLLNGNIHVVAPGATNGGEIKHVGEEVGYVLEGAFELTIGNRVYHLKAGDSFFFRSQLPHSYRNTGTTMTRVLWVNTPPTF